jgi:hypothetical protein
VPLGSLLIGSLSTLLTLRWTLVLGGAVSLICAVWIGVTQPQVRDA